MRTLTLISLLLLTSTAALAQSSDPAYRQSGTRAGGPAGGLISSTGGPVAPRKASRGDKTYARSGNAAGGPAGDTLSSTGGPVQPRARAATNPAYSRSGNAAGGPAGGLSR